MTTIIKLIKVTQTEKQDGAQTASVTLDFNGESYGETVQVMEVSPPFIDDPHLEWIALLDQEHPLRQQEYITQCIEETIGDEKDQLAFKLDIENDYSCLEINISGIRRHLGIRPAQRRLFNLLAIELNRHAKTEDLPWQAICRNDAICFTLPNCEFTLVNRCSGSGLLQSDTYKLRVTLTD
jgi:hypothetical protein